MSVVTTRTLLLIFMRLRRVWPFATNGILIIDVSSKNDASAVDEGVEVLGVTDHGAFHSIYFFDPNGHRLELSCPDPDEQAMLARLDAVKWEMLEEWSRTKRAPRHAAFLHARAFGQ
jgi:hypothetical protein